MDTFYYSPGACSLAVHSVLKLVDARVEMRNVDLKGGQQHAPEYLKVNRLGRVPVLVVDGEPITEVSAILQFLAEKHPEARLLPSDPVQRAKCYSSMSYLASTIHPFFGVLWRPYRFSEDTATHPAITATGRVRLREEFMALNARLEGSTWLLGDNKYLCDYFLFALARWSPAIADVERELPHVAAFVNRMAEDQAVARAIEVEDIPLFRASL